MLCRDLLEAHPESGTLLQLAFEPPTVNTMDMVRSKTPGGGLPVAHVTLDDTLGSCCTAEQHCSRLSTAILEGTAVALDQHGH